jgi:hypothetical protein
VTDILGGRRLLYPDDDVVVTTLPSACCDSVTTNLVQTRGNTFVSQNDQIANEITPSPASFATGIGRMFNLPRDVVVTVVAGFITLYDQTINQEFDNGIGKGPVDQGIIAKADFTGDGFDDFAFLENGNIYIFTAADVNDLSQGFFYSTPMPLPVAGARYALTAGDFDGSGTNELAVASTPAFPVECLGEINNCTEIDIYKPQVTTADGKITSLSLVHIGATTFSTPNLQSLALTAGTYSGQTATNGTLFSQFVVMYQAGSALQLQLQPISVAPATAPNVMLTLGPAFTFPDSFGSLLQMRMTSGYLDFSSNLEQVVAMVQDVALNPAHIYVLSLDSNLNVTLANSLAVSPPTPIVSWDITLGNFDQTTQPVGLEIGLLKFPKIFYKFAECAEPVLNIVQIDIAHSFALSLDQNNGVPIKPGICLTLVNPPFAETIATGDVEGRSALLGPPTEYQVQHIDPRLILGGPPTHVDWVSPADNTPQEVFNLSAVKDGFYSKYTTSVTNTTQSSNQSTTSFAHAVMASESVGYQYGGDLTGSVTAQASVSAGFLHKNFMKNQYSNLYFGLL